MVNSIANGIKELALKCSKWAFSNYYKKGKIFRSSGFDGTYYVITYNSAAKIVIWTFDSKNCSWLNRYDYAIRGKFADRKMRHVLVDLVNYPQDEDLWACQRVLSS